MANKKISVKTADNLLKELQSAVQNKNRTINSIQDIKVKKLVEDFGKNSISANGIVRTMSVGAGVVSGITVAGGIFGTGLGSTLGAGAGAATIAKFSAMGAGAGSTVPGIGTVVGAIGGAAVGGAAVFLTLHHKNKKDNEALALQKETLVKTKNLLNTVKSEMDALEREIEQLKAENKSYQEKIARYEYLAGVYFSANALNHN